MVCSGRRGLRDARRYASSPGLAGAAEIWPSDSVIERAGSLPTLLMFAHPRCPCSRASIAEFAALMEECGGRVRARVLFFKPAGAADEWAHTDLWRTAAAIPGVHVAADRDGLEAKRFHAATSGAVALYDSAGRLLFNGGITAARGERGENDGRRAIGALLTGIPGAPRISVFGCPILEEQKK